MAVDDRFSAQRFQRLSSDPEGLARLIDDLQDAVLEELHPVIAARFREIAAELNALGHHLVLDDEEPGELSYHDLSDPPSGAHCRLRVGVDTIVSAAGPGPYRSLRQAIRPKPSPALSAAARLTTPTTTPSGSG